MFADEELHRPAVENLDRADALLFGRVTYEMMEEAFRPPVRAEARPDWMEHFAQASGPWADVVRGAIEACRLEAREPAGVRVGGGGHAV
jgi:hypothetical protein